jgi:hypothetical protein
MSETVKTPLRATWIKAGRLSMAHMRLAVTTERADTDAMRWGRLVHMAILEPAKFAALPVWRGGRRAGKDWQAFEDEVAAGTGEYITEENSADLLAISGSARIALATLPAVEATEVQIDWTDALYGKATARIDALTSVGSMIEIKTCAKIDERLFRSQAWSLGYNLQLGWYHHGLLENGKDGQRYVLAIESKPPYCTAVYTVPVKVLNDGYEEAAEIARRYRICESTGRFAGPYDGTVMKLEPPDWTMGDDVDMEGAAEV